MVSAFSAMDQRFHRASWAKCHQIISKCHLACQGSVPVRPHSAAGLSPADCAASSYWESTMRRSNSIQRGSLLLDRSIAPPLFQKAGQDDAHAVLMFSKSVTTASAAWVPKWQVRSIELVPVSGVRINW